MEIPKAPEYVPVAREPGQVGRPAQPGAPPKTDSGVDAAVRDTVEKSSGTP